MPIRTTRVSKKNLRIGMHAFVIGGYGYPKNKQVAIKIEILSLPAPTVGDACQAIEVKAIFTEDQQRDPPFSTKFYIRNKLFPGDCGIRPWNYDQRPTQLFTTRAACEKAIKAWEGKNPNFLKGP